MTITDEQRANRQAWIAALESREYSQGRGKLETSDGKYCCLGVACVLAGVQRTVKTFACGCGDLGCDLSGFVGVEYDGEGNYRPPSVMNWLGVLEPNPVVFPDGDFRTLASLNDAGRPFVEIAQILRELPDEWDGSRD